MSDELPAIPIAYRGREIEARVVSRDSPTFAADVDALDREPGFRISRIIQFTDREFLVIRERVRDDRANVTVAV